MAGMGAATALNSSTNNSDIERYYTIKPNFRQFAGVLCVNLGQVTKLGRYLAQEGQLLLL